MPIWKKEGIGYANAKDGAGISKLSTNRPGYGLGKQVSLN